MTARYALGVGFATEELAEAVFVTTLGADTLRTALAHAALTLLFTATIVARETGARRGAASRWRRLGDDEDDAGQRAPSDGGGAGEARAAPAPPAPPPAPGGGGGLVGSLNAPLLSSAATMANDDAAPDDTSAREPSDCAPSECE